MKKSSKFGPQPYKVQPKQGESKEMPAYKPLPTDWITDNPILRSLEAASAPPQEESEGENSTQLSAESETIQRQGESAAQSDGVANQLIMRSVQVTPPEIMPPTIVQMRAELGLVQRMYSESEAELAEEEEKQPIQTKLTVGAPGDHYEQEADRVAAQVMSMPDNSPQVQRFPEEDNSVQMSSLAQSITPLVQRQVDESVQMRELVQRSIQGEETQASLDLESRLNASKGGGSPLAPEVQAFMEPRFGADFSAVRVHTGGEAVQMNRELGAQAFTHGSDVYFGAGKSPGNNELTAHELTHVVQQTGGIQRLCDKCEGELSDKEEKQPIQAELAVGEAGDKYKQEADAVARDVVEKINAPQTQESVQRQSELGEVLVPNITVMRWGENGTSGGMSVSEDVEQGIQQARGGGQGIDESVRQPMEQAFGADFSGVQARTAELPTTDILQTHPFAPKVQPQEEMPDLQTRLERAERVGYNAANIPLFAPSTPVLQREEGELGGWYQPTEAEPVLNGLNHFKVQQFCHRETVVHDTRQELIQPLMVDKINSSPPAIQRVIEIQEEGKEFKKAAMRELIKDKLKLTSDNLPGFEDILMELNARNASFSTWDEFQKELQAKSAIFNAPNRELNIVPPGTYGIYRGFNSTGKILCTSGMASCTGLILRDPKRQVALLAHFLSASSSSETALNGIVSELPVFNPQTTQALIFTGESANKSTKNMVKKIKNVLAKHQIIPDEIQPTLPAFQLDAVTGKFEGLQNIPEINKAGKARDIEKFSAMMGSFLEGADKKTVLNETVDRKLAGYVPGVIDVAIWSNNPIKVELSKVASGKKVKKMGGNSGEANF